MKLKFFHNMLKPFKSLIVFLLEIESLVSKKWTASAHKRLFSAEWKIPPIPEFFDHQIDLYYLWLNKRMFCWLERGIFSSLALKRSGEVLELACGDGFNARNFYSGIAKSVIACDSDDNAISTAKRKNGASNIKFILSDIRFNMPDGNFDNIVWDAAIGYFTSEEIIAIMKNIKDRLSNKKGILSGYAVIEKVEGEKIEYYEHTFQYMADLKKFLDPYFKNVIIFETTYPQRYNFYFWASDSTVPFSETWKHWIIK